MPSLLGAFVHEEAFARPEGHCFFLCQPPTWTDYQGPRGTARNDKSLKCFISVAAPRNPMVLRLETPSCCASKPLRRPSKPHGAVPRNPRCAAPQNPWGQILRPKFSSFGGF